MSKERDDALEEAARVLEQPVVLFSSIDVLAKPHEERKFFAAQIRSLKGPSPSPETKPLPPDRGCWLPGCQCARCRGIERRESASPSPVSGLMLEEVAKVRALLEQLAEVATFDAQVPWDENKSPADVAREALALLDGRKAGK